MKEEDTLKFTNSIILLSKLLTRIEDGFFAQKLHQKISDMVFAFLEFKKVRVEQVRLSNIAKNMTQFPEIEQRGYVAQYEIKELLNSINKLLDCLEYLEHVSKKNTTPLFVAQRNLLKFKLYVLKQSKDERMKQISDVVPAPNNVVDSPLVAFKPLAKTKTARLALKSNSNKEKIFNFIKRSPEMRTKDIMNKFNALSDRTVKRNLRELTDEGFLKKKLDGGAVYYLIIE